MHNGKRIKMEAACKRLLAATSSASTIVSGTTLLKKSWYRQNSMVSLFRIFKPVFFLINPWNLLTSDRTQHYFLPFFFHGWSPFELEERCFLRRGGGYGGSRGPSSFSGTCAFPLALSDFFSFGSESLSETSMHCKAEPRFEPSPMVQPTGPLVPLGLACSQAMSAGDTKTPACKARVRRHISMM